MRETLWNAESVMREAIRFAYDGFPHPKRNASYAARVAPQTLRPMAQYLGVIVSVR